MPLFAESERAFAEAVSRLVYANPFLPERVAYERQALRDEFTDSGPVWHARSAEMEESPNVLRLNERAERVVEQACARLQQGVAAGTEERHLFRDLVFYLLYNRFQNEFLAMILEPAKAQRKVPFYERFAAELERLTCLDGWPQEPEDPAHLFSLFFQIRRAFHLTFRHILGGSMPAAKLRAAVWQSIFTHDTRRYQRSLYRQMADVTTLVNGPSGTGKELVARAIGLARYIPFDPASRSFVAEFEGLFFPLNLSALSPTLIESELFGHRKGSFTGAVEDRNGWLEVCPSLGTVFLDEIGEVDVAIQVKLLRVLESRIFQRLGDTRERRFEGKIIAATNRDLAVEMRAGRMREDLYYRVCSDLVTTPALAEQLVGDPGELETLIGLLAYRLVEEEEADGLASEVVTWIDRELGRDYAWPGNVRELEQCVRNVMIRGAYRPPKLDGLPVARLAAEFEQGRLSAEEMLRRYVTLVYSQSGSYQEAGRRLGFDRRTVKAKLDPDLLADLRGESL